MEHVKSYKVIAVHEVYTSALLGILYVSTLFLYIIRALLCIHIKYFETIVESWNKDHTNLVKTCDWAAVIIILCKQTSLVAAVCSPI